MKILVDGLVVKSDKIVDTADTTWSKSNNKTNYWLFDIILLVITCLLLLAIIVFKYYMKHGLTIPCLSLYEYIILGHDRIDISEDIDII